MNTGWCLLVACLVLSTAVLPVLASDRPAISLKAAEISVYRCVDEKKRAIIKHQIPAMTRQQALDACIAEYAASVKEHTEVREKLIEDITKTVDPYAGAMPPDRQH